MHRLRLHLRPVVVAVATLALSAGVVFAGGGVVMPEAAADGLAVAAEAAGKVVPPAVGLPAVPNEPADEEPAEEEPAEEEPSEEPATEEEPAEEPCPVLDEYPNHGAKVCAAAQGEVPEGYASRGAYVREVARANHGSEIAAQKEANGGVPDAAKAAKERSKEKPKAGGAGSPPNRP
jgi:hypothetical protein